MQSKKKTASRSFDRKEEARTAKEEESTAPAVKMESSVAAPKLTETQPATKMMPTPRQESSGESKMRPSIGLKKPKSGLPGQGMTTSVGMQDTQVPIMLTSQQTTGAPRAANEERERLRSTS